MRQSLVAGLLALFGGAAARRRLLQPPTRQTAFVDLRLGDADIALEHDTAFGIDEIDRAAEPLLVVVDQVLNGIDGQTDTGDTDEVTVVIDNPIVDEEDRKSVV